MNEALYNILRWINSWSGSWGVAMIIFTILIRAALTPLDLKSRASMRRTQKLQPQIQALQKKYANDKDKLNAKTAELYKKERINPLSSCLPLLLTWPILIIVFNAMRMAANLEMLKQVGQMLDPNDSIKMEQFLWIKNLWMPDNMFRAAFPDATTLRAIPADQWVRWFEELKATEAFSRLPAEIQALTSTHFDSNNIATTIETIMGYINVTGSEYAQAFESTGYAVPFFGTIPKLYNGLLLLPVLSAVSQIVMTKITTKGQPEQPANGQPNTGKFMQWFFPIFSLWICLSATASFALYWVAGNLVSMVQTVVINKVLDKREAMAATVAGEGNVK